MIGTVFVKMVGNVTNQLLKYRACAWYNPSWTCASVPIKTSSSPTDSNATLSFSELKNFATRSTIRMLRGLDKFDERFTLALSDLFVAHQLIEPSPGALRQNRCDQARLLAGFHVRAAHVDKNPLRAGHFQRPCN